MKARRFYFARRNPALSADEFPRVWPTHSDLLQTFPLLAERFACYSYLHVQHQWPQGEVPGSIDGIGAFWLTERYGALTAEEQQLLFRSVDPEGSRAMREDEYRLFAEPVGNAAVSADEWLIAKGPPDCACLVGVHFAPDGRDLAIDASAVAARIVEETAGLARSGRAAINIVRGGSLPAALISEHWISGAADAAPGAWDGEIRRRITNVWALAAPGGRSEFYRTRPCHKVSAGVEA